MLQRFDVPDTSSDSGSESAELSNKRRRVRSESESSSGSSASSRSDEPGDPLPTASGLMLSQLVAVNEGQTENDLSVYARQAKNPDRIKKVLKEPCCQKNCKKHLGWKLVLKVIGFFWMLPKVSQDCILWSMQQRHMVSGDQDEGLDSDSESTDQPSYRIAWSFEGRDSVNQCE